MSNNTPDQFPSVDSPHSFGPNTMAVHAGQGERFANFPVPSLVLNSAIPLESVEQGWDMLTNELVANTAYQRYANPTVLVLEEKFAALEQNQYALAFNSGMAACYAVFRSLLANGDHVVSQHSTYHEISDQLKYDKDGCGIDSTFVSDHSVAAFEAAMTPRTKMVFVETPVNPSMLDVDIAGLARLCADKGVLLVVDNTLLTCEYQKPLALGADVCVYSTTKTLNGHGDSMGGIVSTNSAELLAKLRTFRENTGSGLDPFSAWLVVRGLRTLRLRLDRHSQNARHVMDFLQRQYPQFPVYSPLTGDYMQANKVVDCGGVFSLVLDTKEQGTAFLRNVSLLKVATTFGNLESLCYHFATFMRAHRDREQLKIPDGLVRLSIGIEDPADICEDIRMAIEKS